MGKRNYGIDLLRMILMFMVVVLHVLGNGGILNAVPLFSMNYHIAWFIECACYCAVNCYALITGYVHYNRQFRLSALVMIWLQVIVYTLGITITIWAFTDTPVSLGYLLHAFFAPNGSSLWYVPAYSGVLILMPILNAAVKSLSEKAAMRFAIISFAAFALVQHYRSMIPFISHMAIVRCGSPISTYLEP